MTESLFRYPEINTIIVTPNVTVNDSNTVTVSFFLVYETEIIMEIWVMLQRKDSEKVYKTTNTTVLM